MWLRDDAMNWSDLSNAATAQAGANFPDRITGSVRTAAGEGITGVLVEAYDSEGVIKASAYTLADTSGSYALQGLVYGFYRLQVSWSVSGIPPGLPNCRRCGHDTVRECVWCGNDRIAPPAAT